MQDSPTPPTGTGPDGGVTVRLVRADDADRLSALEIANREALLMGSPPRSDYYVSPAGQHEVVTALLAAAEAGTALPLVVELGGTVVGRVTLSNILRGPLQSASVSYWLDSAARGRGVMVRALTDVVERAFSPADRTFPDGGLGLGLHRLEAGCRPDNPASARVLTQAGFREFGYARDYLRLGQTWYDHRLFERTNPSWTLEDAA